MFVVRVTTLCPQNQNEVLLVSGEIKVKFVSQQCTFHCTPAETSNNH